MELSEKLKRWLESTFSNSGDGGPNGVGGACGDGSLAEFNDLRAAYGEKGERDREPVVLLAGVSSLGRRKAWSRGESAMVLSSQEVLHSRRTSSRRVNSRWWSRSS